MREPKAELIMAVALRVVPRAGEHEGLPRDDLSRRPEEIAIEWGSVKGVEAKGPGLRLARIIQFFEGSHAR
jgi:hypothetical protein